MSKEEQGDIPQGFRLRHSLRGHKQEITQIAWSPTGKIIASSSLDRTVCIWNVETGQLLQSLQGHTHAIRDIAWSPDGTRIASCSEDKTIRIWDANTGRHLRTLLEHVSKTAVSIAWSLDGEMIASGCTDDTISLWNPDTGQHLDALQGSLFFNKLHRVMWSPDGKILAGCSGKSIRFWNTETRQKVLNLEGDKTNSNIGDFAWSPNMRKLASCSEDKTIRIWNINQKRQTDILEGHIEEVTDVCFSNDGYLLASKGVNDTVRIWRTDTWETVGILQEEAGDYSLQGLAFHPGVPILASPGEKHTAIRIWDIDIPDLLATSSTHYTNAKVVLVGDTGVGKSGLGLVLTGQPFVPTESTHGRNVWTFDSLEVELGNRGKETRETWLWDLAGQPGYRLIHQLHLNDVAVALLVFDSRSETDPFAGIDHWIRALRATQRIPGNSAIPMKKFLVAARIDRSGKSVGQERIEALIQEWSIDGFFETSSKESRNIANLTDAIKNAINWDALPKVTSTKLFQLIKSFLVARKEAGHLLSSAHDLYRSFLTTEEELTESENLYAQFETCIGRVESQGLIRRLSFGNLVLLQPELLDSYASALVNAVRDEPDGLGSIREEDIKDCHFAMPEDQRMTNKEQERILLIAMVEDLLRYEIALREQGDDGAYLVFPSQSTRENPNLPDPDGKAVIFTFEGPVRNVYATLAVRLSHSGLFQKKELWKDAVIYTTKKGGTYGMFLHNAGEGRAELILFFDKTAGEETRFHFEEYIKTHLERWALEETIRRRPIFVCPECGNALDDSTVRKRRERGFDWMTCGVCDTKVSLIEWEKQLTTKADSQIAAMDRAANNQRDRAAATAILEGKIAMRDFDVFLCHNGKDKPQVKEIGERLKEYGILPWLDEWELPPGKPWQRLLEQQIGQIKSAAVFVGSDGLGPWQHMELDAFLRDFVKRDCPVIPVLLADAPKEPQLPVFLNAMTWVDFRKQDSDPMKRLIWGITGQRDHFV